MRKTLIILSLLFISFTANAEFTSLGKNSKGTEYLIDYGSIRKNGQFVKVWTYIIPGYQSKGVEIASSKTQDEFDCKNELRRTLYIIIYSDIAAQNIVKQFKHDGEWSPILPGSAEDGIAKLLCN